jgi:hypothetical protein
MADGKLTVLTPDGHLTRHPREIETEKLVARMRMRIDRVAKLKGVAPVETVAPKWPDGFRQDQTGRIYVAGDFFGFRHLPATRFSVPQFRRYSALRIFAVEPTEVVAALLDGAFDYPPTLSEVEALPVLRLTRYSTPGELASSRVPVAGGFAAPNPTPFLRFRWLGNLPPTQGEIEAVGVPTRAFAWTSFCADAEAEWRWRHDREQFLEEIARECERDAKPGVNHELLVRLLPLMRKGVDLRQGASSVSSDDPEQLVDDGLQAAFERDAMFMAAADYYRDRLKELTWGKLLSERHFEDWKGRSRALAEGAGEAMNKAIRAVVALGPKPKKAAVRAVLKSCVDWFNAEDDRLGGVIETIEREDILQLLADICFVAKQGRLIHEIDEWRTW